MYVCVREKERERKKERERERERGRERKKIEATVSQMKDSPSELSSFLFV
jgi:hypothetical protein